MRKKSKIHPPRKRDGFGKKWLEFGRKFWKFYLLLVLLLIPLYGALQLQLWSIGMIGIYLGMMLPFHVKLWEEKKRQTLRLEEVSQYMDAMLYAFQKELKVYNALADVCETMVKGPLATLLVEVRNYMDLTYDETDVMAKGLETVYKAYPSKRVRNMHEFMLHVENYGGEVADSIKLLLQEKEMWELRMKHNLTQREKMFRDVVLSVIASVSICGIVMAMPVMDFDFCKSPISQGLSVAMLVLNQLIILKAQKYLAVDWIPMEEQRDDAYYEKKRQAYLQWNPKRQKLLSVVLAVIAGLGTAVAFILDKFWLGCGGILLTVLCMFQHELGHRLLEKTLQKEVMREFPAWLMDLILLLQSENVQNAFVKSLANAPGILKEELEQFIGKVQLDPEGAGPYHDFLYDYHVPEIRSAMNLLYAMSMGQGGNASHQISNLIRRNQEMQNEAEKQMDQDRTSGLYLLFLAPVLTGGMKMLVDMGLMMLSFLSVSI